MTSPTPDLSALDKVEDQIQRFHANPGEGGIDWMPFGVSEVETLLALSRWALEAKEALKRFKDEQTCLDSLCGHRVCKVNKALSSFPSIQ